MDNSYIPIESSSHRYSGSYINQSTPPKRSKTKIIIIAIVAMVILCSAGVIAVILADSSTKDSEEIVENADYIASLKDPNDNTEELNSHLSELIKTAPHTDYSTLSTDTPYNSAADSLFSSKGSVSDAVYAAAFSALKNQPIVVDSLKDQTPQSVAASQNIKIESVSAVNAKAINYYLDHSSVLIIEATGPAPFDSNAATPVLIYGGRPDLGIYYYFTPDAKCSECDFPYQIDKIQLFNAIKDNEKFTIISNNVVIQNSGDEIEHE